MLGRAIAVAFLSVCLSNACIVTKGNNHLQIYQHYRPTKERCFLRTKFRDPELQVHPERVRYRQVTHIESSNLTDNLQ